MRYRLGLQASEIKERIMRFMNTFNPTKKAEGNNEGTFLEERIDLTVEQRERAYSQDNIGRNDLSEMIETKTIGS